jgi:hypothetical protein
MWDKHTPCIGARNEVGAKRGVRYHAQMFVPIAIVARFEDANLKLLKADHDSLTEELWPKLPVNLALLRISTRVTVRRSRADIKQTVGLR